MNLDVFGATTFSWMCMFVFQQQQTEIRFSAKLRLHVFWSCIFVFFNKFMEKMNGFGCFWREFEEFLEMDDEFEHIEFIQLVVNGSDGNGQEFISHRCLF